ncbi:unnamed protein product [Parascedosporium putredinis]|uniref:Anaphase-promoting complex subunit 1 N-terminal domain-containing protein n=1 Tax=Parascedosporium putredinis TaxID=1442378 RepID=A0A9P1M9U2_9PEZI|nr:unnamed protein product [Parascedosporium putredinis]CAI7996211.1 unnamed protein product [Parascedosporium putredinis]
MASVKSLGLHQPAGLRHAIQEQILPPNPKPSDYRWEIFVEHHEDQDIEDELLVTDTCVVWSRGQVFRKAFRLDLEKETITQALLTYFPTSENERTPETALPCKIGTEKKLLAKALVVFLKTQAHIYFLSGTSHVVHMPFEVESACAAPQGVIIQRKQRSDAFAPVSLTFPRVPPNSFVSSQVTNFTASLQRPPTSSSFSVEGLGKPKVLPLRLSSTLGNMWESPMEQPESHWPRLVCLTDPLLELGLVVGAPETNTKGRLKPAVHAVRPLFLDPAEEILHIEKVYDAVQSNFRESFGAPLPGKRTRTRKSEPAEKAKDLVASSLEQDTEQVTRRQSRRISSMLARADLSTSQYAEQPILTGHNTSKRLDSYGSQYGRQSGGYGSFNYSQTIHPSLNSLLEAPINNVLDELRAGGDFEGFHNMGIDDHELDGLAQEMSFTKIKSIPVDTTNIRYSASSQPAITQCRVFILGAPPSAVDENQRTQVVIGIQDTLEKRLQLLTLHFPTIERPELLSKANKKPISLANDVITPQCGELRRAESVVDSCKISHGNLSLTFILSEKLGGGHELSIQAPWGPMTTIALPLLFLDNVRSLQFNGRAVDRDLRQQKSETISCENGSIVSLAHPKGRGTVDLVDAEGRRHQVRIQLQPSSPIVRRILDVCANILPFPHGGKLLGGWWHVMQWCKQEGIETADIEWSCLVIELLASYLALDPSNFKSRPQRASTSRRKRRTASSSFSIAQATEDWNSMLAHEAKNSLACPEWMLGPGWQWAFDDIIQTDPKQAGSSPFKTGFMSTHVRYAKQFLTSTAGDHALGTLGYLPTSQAVDPDFRRRTASDMFLALHLLLEEQKLDIMTPDNSPSGGVNLKVVLCQLAQWLGWFNFSDLYSIGIQEDLDPSLASETVEAIHRAGITTKVIESLPESLLVPIRDAISRCQPHPPNTWPAELLDLVNRSDMNLVMASTKRLRPYMTQLLPPTHTASWDVKMLCESLDEYNNFAADEGEGSELQSVIRALFKDDRRLNEAQDILSTHKARIVHLDPVPGSTESEYLEQQKELVSRIATGTLAIPAGRGLLYYSLRFPLLTQKFHIGGFNLNCVVKPTNVTVGVDKALFTEEKVCWGFFHQGVSAGLSISPHAKGIDTSWILYNKPGQDLSNRHAGFLLALGLNGHLKGVAKWVAFKYLTPKHTMTSIGLLLGLAASYMGTMDSLITRLLSVHVTRMLPRGAAELNLSPLTQTSGIMGIGLLYCQSQHRRMSEVMMSEIEHIDEEDEEEPLRSEGYRLAAGFALGFINLGKGPDLKGLHDMKLTEKLIGLATATKKVEVTHILDRAAAGAVMAIALMYMKSNDHIVARKIDVPDSIIQFDYIRPDILMLRTLAKHIIMWSKIQPTREWVRNSLPKEYQPGHLLTSYNRLTTKSLPFFSILGGICFALGLRFAGSANPDARDLLVSLLDQLIRITRLESSSKEHPVYDEELARTYARTCQDIVAISASLVMAGTGDLAVLRRLRSLHGRDDPTTPYGSHLAAHLAVGALFLGCGTATFATTEVAVASLLVAFYPVFPTTVMDNRSHLQAFRHFWVLATDQRCLVAKDISTGQPVSVPNTPCLLPPLEDIVRLRTDAGPMYWDIDLDLSARPAPKRPRAKPQTLSSSLSTSAAAAAARTHHPTPQRRSTCAAGPKARTVLGALVARRAYRGPWKRGVLIPVAWLFTLPALAGLTPSDRAAVLNADPDRLGSAVDARLALQQATSNGQRDALLGLRLVFEWARRRGEVHQARRKKRGSKTYEGSGGEEDGEEEDWWIRTGVVEGLRGGVWLAGREQ